MCLIISLRICKDMCLFSILNSARKKQNERILLCDCYDLLFLVPKQQTFLNINIEKNNLHPGLEKSSSGPLPSVSVDPPHCSKPKTAGFSASDVQPHKSPVVSKSQPEIQAVDEKQTNISLLPCVCLCGYVWVFVWWTHRGSVLLKWQCCPKQCRRKMSEMNLSEPQT